jgi:hypothetical protein
MADRNSYLVQILLPLKDNQGKAFPDSLFSGIQKVVTERYGGFTAYNRSPAQGVWACDGRRSRDEILVLEVMTGKLEVAWWKDFRRRLEKTMRQEEIVVRIQSIKVV